ncbi:MAG: hypothetical protein MRY83_23950 [Flavobacteriales bacterium]|nr:hypothetical protein [Flavobacteriales bacterium]
MKPLNAVLTFMIIMLAIVLGIRSFREFDLWIFIKTGEWINDNKSFIHKDFLSFSFEGEPWRHFKYGYSLLAYKIVTLFTGPQYLLLLQSFFNLCMALLLKKFLKRVSSYNIASWALCAILVLLGCEFRMNARPEWFSYLFTLAFTIIGHKGFSEGSKNYCYLILIQILWVNLHDAFVIGNVITIILILLELIREKGLTKNIAPLVVTYVSTIFNPYSFEAFSYPLEIFGQLGSNKYTFELHNIFTSEYWSIWQAYLIPLLGLSLIISLFFSIKKKTFRGDVFLFIMGFALLFLSFKAQRNIPLACLIITPLAVSHFKFKRTLIIGVLLFLTPFLYIMTISDKYYETAGSRIRYGLQIDPHNLPIKASDYIQHNLKENDKGFADYLSSAYLLYKLPNFKSFIDMRDLDVFDHEHFKKYNEITKKPKNFDQLDAIYHFDYVCLYTQDNFFLHFYLYHHQFWYCAYIDENTAVYLKDSNKATNNPQPEVGQYNSVSDTTPINKIFNWNYRADSSMNASQFNYLISKYFQRVAAPEKAIEFARKSISRGELYEGHILLAKLLFKMLQYNSEKRIFYLNEIEATLKRAIEMKPNQDLAYQGLGQLYIITNQNEQALKQFETAFDFGAKINIDSLQLQLQ